MKKKAQFPARGSTRWVPFIKEPAKREEGEDEKAFARRAELAAALEGAELEVVLVGREAVIALNHRLQVLIAQEDRRAREAEQKGEVLSAGFTLPGALEIRAFHKMAIVGGEIDGIKVPPLALRARGILVGDVDLENASSPAELADLLDAAGLLADASRLARESQSPNPKQTER